jgi:hypothetical protein
MGASARSGVILERSVFWRRMRCTALFPCQKHCQLLSVVIAAVAAENTETASCRLHPCSLGGCCGIALEMLHSRSLESWAAATLFTDET